jgi:hypothetical protein
MGYLPHIAEAVNCAIKDTNTWDKIKFMNFLFKS